MNVPTEKKPFTRREALAIVAGSATAVLVATSSATSLGSALAPEAARTGTPPPPADEPRPFVLSF